VSEPLSESVRLAERQRLLMSTAEIQRVRLALDWRLMRQQMQPEALASVALANLRRRRTWWLAAATLLTVVARRLRRPQGEAGATSLTSLLRLASWALRRFGG
jgi:hypothetical protein